MFPSSEPVVPLRGEHPGKMWMIGEGEYTLVILALGKWRQKDQEFEANPRHIKLSQNNKIIATICKFCAQFSELLLIATVTFWVSFFA